MARARPLLAALVALLIAGGCGGQERPTSGPPLLHPAGLGSLPALLTNWPGAAAAYRNPVVAADLPDPTVVRRGSEYWATATNRGSLQPVFSLLRSADLVNWRQVGAVFDRPPRWTTESWWAPHLVRWRGGFLLFYSAVRRDGAGRCIGVAVAAAPDARWRDAGRVVCGAGAPIDPTTVRGRGGRLFLLWRAEGVIRGQPLSAKGTRVVGAARDLLRSGQRWERGVVEAPEVIRRGRGFVLLYSGAVCCGRRCSYALGAARAPAPLGPYRKFSGNPVLRGNGAWRCPGHGSAVGDVDGRTWLLYHAYPRRGIGFVGREMLLDEIAWRDGWPVIGNERGPSSSAAAPAGGQRRSPVVADDFSKRRLDPRWRWAEGRRPAATVARGRLLLRSDRSRGGDPERLFFASPADPVWRAEAAASAEGAGLGAWWGPGIWLERTSSGVRAWVSNEQEGGGRRLLGRLFVPPGAGVRLRLAARYNRFTLSISRDGRSWRTVATYRATVTDRWAFGTSVALSARGSTSFDWVRLTPAA